MSYSFPKGKESIVITPSDELAVHILRENVSFTTDDEFTGFHTMLYTTTLGNAIRGRMEEKALDLKEKGYTVFHFFGKNSREMYLIGFAVTEGESEFD